MRTNNVQIAIDLLLNDDTSSSAASIPDCYGFCVQAVIDGTPSGQFKLQASADPFKYVTPNTPQEPINWADVEDSELTVSAAGVYQWNVDAAYYNFIRLVYQDTSSGMSTATATITVNMKGV